MFSISGATRGTFALISVPKYMNFVPAPPVKAAMRTSLNTAWPTMSGGKAMR